MISIGFSLILVGLLLIEFLMIFMILFYSSNIEFHVSMMIYMFPCIIWFSSHDSWVFKLIFKVSKHIGLWTMFSWLSSYFNDIKWVVIRFTWQANSRDSSLLFMIFKLRLKVGTQAYFHDFKLMGVYTNSCLLSYSYCSISNFML